MILPEVLDIREQTKYFEEWCNNNDYEAREELITHNLRLVAYISQKRNYINEQEDLFSVGIIGLIKAVDSYNPAAFHKFSTYAYTCIENEIDMYLRKFSKYGFFTEINTNTADTKIGLEEWVEDLDEKVILEKLIAKLPTDERFYITQRYGGRSQRDICEMIHHTQSYCSKLEKKIIGKLRGGFIEQGYALA